MNSMNTEVSRLLSRLNAPANIKPFDRSKLISEAKQDSKQLANDCKARMSNNLINQSGLNTRFMGCSFDNYQTRGPEQAKAKKTAKDYCDRFSEMASAGKGFLFWGTAGTGKNHLASAMTNALIARNKTVVLMSVMDMFAKARETYGNNGVTEEKLLREFTRPDLLIIDEVGLQRGTVDEMLWLTRIIDKRLYALKPMGFITNLDHKALRKSMGERAYDRLREAVAVAVKFNWPSFRGNGEA